MSLLSSKLRKWAHGNREGLIYWCQGCESAHQVIIAGPGAWGWNGDVDRPVFTPSVLTTYPGPDAGRDGAPPAVCHTFVGCNGAKPGEVIFLSDCTHALAGTVQPFPDLPDYLRNEA